MEYNLKELLQIGDVTKLNDKKNKNQNGEIATVFYKNGLIVSISKIQNYFLIVYLFNYKKTSAMESSFSKVIRDITLKYQSI